MNQINIRVEPQINDLITYLSDKKKIPKALYVKQIFLDNLTEKILPILLDDYSQGKIGLKKILHLTSIDPDELLKKIIELDIEPPITSEIDEYTDRVLQRITRNLNL